VNNDPKKDEIAARLVEGIWSDAAVIPIVGAHQARQHAIARVVQALSDYEALRETSLEDAIATREYAFGFAEGWAAAIKAGAEHLCELGEGAMAGAYPDAADARERKRRGQ
jgi:hypothetical protein